MKVKVFYPNSKGEIVFTKEELEKLLDEVYDAGYSDGRSRYWTWTSPSITSPYYTTCSNRTITTSASSDDNNQSVTIKYGDGPRVTLDDDTVYINQTSTGKSFSLNDYVTNLVKD
jgi:hypothetical protein